MPHGVYCCSGSVCGLFFENVKIRERDTSRLRYGTPSRRRKLHTVSNLKVNLVSQAGTLGTLFRERGANNVTGGSHF